MKLETEDFAAIAAGRTRVLSLLQRVEKASSRDDLAIVLGMLRTTLHEQGEMEAAVGLPEEVRETRSHEEILGIIDAEITELRAETDGVWREHKLARDALVRRIRRHEDTISRALVG